jgi:hypothetical protein
MYSASLQQSNQPRHVYVNTSDFSAPSSASMRMPPPPDSTGLAPSPPNLSVSPRNAPGMYENTKPGAMAPLPTSSAASTMLPTSTGTHKYVNTMPPAGTSVPPPVQVPADAPPHPLARTPTVKPSPTNAAPQGFEAQQSVRQRPIQSPPTQPQPSLSAPQQQSLSRKPTVNSAKTKVEPWPTDLYMAGMLTRGVRMFASSGLATMR